MWFPVDDAPAVKKSIRARYRRHFSHINRVKHFMDMNQWLGNVHLRVIQVGEHTTPVYMAEEEFPASEIQRDPQALSCDVDNISVVLCRNVTLS
jgi:hypothetical protein